MNDYNMFGGQQGWICPKCGAVMSPTTTFCPFCAPSNNKTVAGTNIEGTSADLDWLKYQTQTISSGSSKTAEKK